MKLNLIATFVFILFICAHETMGQIDSTFNNFTGTWSSPTSWAAGPPAPLEDAIIDNIDVYGYITSNNPLSFANVNSGKDLNIFDTLVVHGSMSFANKAHNLYVHDGALLVVFGNFSATNKITVSSGGTIAITGSMTFSESGNDTFENTGSGKLYVGEGVSGNTAAASIDEHPDALADSSDPGELALYSFINGEGETPLPITLGHFTVRLHTSGIALSWQTLSEENFDYFEVQRSGNGITFEVIGTVEGNGFTSEPHEYSFTDTQPALGFNYYRLNAIDFDGSSEVFQVIRVENQPDFSTVRLYPNPGNGLSLQLDIPHELLATGPLSLTISDLKGRTVDVLEITDLHSTAFFKSKLPGGLYIAHLAAGRYAQSIPIIVR